MQRHILLLLTICTVAIFSSCSKDNEPDRSTEQSDFYQNLRGQDYIDYYNTPNVFFNHAKVNESDQTVNGWFVDVEGKLYTYETTLEKFPVIEPIIKINRISKLQDIGQLTDQTIDLNELVDYYKKTRNAANGDFDLGHGDAGAPVSYYFNAYDLQLGNGACLNCPVSQVSRDENAQLVLKAEGTLNGAIDFPDAREIVEWMKTIDERL